MSTTKQGESGLGLDAQREAVARYTSEKGGLVLAEFTEVESGEKAANRPELLKAMERCRREAAAGNKHGCGQTTATGKRRAMPAWKGFGPLRFT